jgi:DNA-binding NtrC family response regulator
MRNQDSSKTTVLLIEDDPKDRTLILGSLREQYKVEVAVDYTQAESKIKKSNFDVVFLDLMLPTKQGGRIHEDGELGFKLLKLTREIEPLVPIVVISALASTKMVLRILQEGIVDFIVKDDLEDQLPMIMLRAELIRQGRIEQLILRRESRVLESNQFVFASPVMEKVIDQITNVAREDISVLLLGETGVGKEVVAREIHSRSPRSTGPFVSVNCGAIAQGLLESELFGHEKGAFTGADKRKVGLFELAHNGTLFLDEITEMPLDLQVKLLRVLQEHNFRRVGGEKTLSVNVRIIAATNKEIESEVKGNRFREDLFYRIAVMQVTIPPLRERTEDIECLVKHFIDKYRPVSDITLSPKVIRSLKNYNWPGNVRELENVVQRILSTFKSNTGTIYPRDVVSCIPTPGQDPIPVEDGQYDLVWIEKQVIEKALQHFGTQTEAVKHLGISESTLRRKIQEFGITYKRVGKTQILEDLSGTERQLQIIRKYLQDNETFRTREIIDLLGDVTKKTAILRLNELIHVREIIRISRGKYRRIC